MDRGCKGYIDKTDLMELGGWVEREGGEGMREEEADEVLNKIGEGGKITWDNFYDFNKKYHLRFGGEGLSCGEKKI